jgi:hypothetical protein
MKKASIKKLIAAALEEIGDLEIVKAVIDPFPKAERPILEPLKVSPFAAVLANVQR